MEIPNRIYTCELCNRFYKNERCFLKHSSICNILSNTKQQNKQILERKDEDIPSINDLFKAVTELSYKYNKLQKDYDKLKVILNKKHKIDINEFLSKFTPIKYNDWLDTLTVTTENLEFLFKHNFVDCFTDIIKKNISGKSNSPIRCFSIKENIFYIYDDEWKIQTKEQFDMIIKMLYKKVFKMFKEWQDNNKEGIRNGTLPVDEHLNKICKFMENEQLISTKIKNRLYQIFKETVDLI